MIIVTVFRFGRVEQSYFSLECHALRFLQDQINKCPEDEDRLFTVEGEEEHPCAP